MTGLLSYQKPEFPGYTAGPGISAGTAFDASFGYSQRFLELTNQWQQGKRALAPFTGFIQGELKKHKGDPKFDAVATSLQEPAMGTPTGQVVYGWTENPAKWEKARLQLADMGVKNPAPGMADYTVAQSQINQAEQAKLQHNFYTGLLDRAYGAGAKAGSLAGSFGAGMDNIEVVATMPIGASARVGIAATMLTEAAVGGASAVPVAVQSNTYLRSLGFKGDGVASQVVNTALLSGLMGGAFKGIPGSVKVAKGLVKALKKSPAPEAKLAAKIIQVDTQTAEAAAPSGAPTSVQEAQDRANMAAVALHDAAPADMPDRPLLATQPDATQVTVPGALEMIPVDTLKVEPDKFQFKSAVVASGGVTKKLLDVKKWLDSLAGRIVVFEYKDGTRSIVDGHQRVALAKRIMQQDPSQKIHIPGEVMREADGFTVEDARVAGAAKNIAESADGISGKLAMDAAKIFRIDPKTLHEKVRAMVENLPSGPGIKKARDLARLSEDAFSLAINQVIPENYAAAIGRLVPDQRLHEPIARLIEKTKPENQTQAESIITQAKDTPVSQEKTVDLFGSHTVTESLFLERAKVLDRAIKMLREDRALFKTLTEDAARAEAVKGNKLNKKSNEEIRREVEKALAVIQANAHRAGPISEALNVAAKEYKKTGKIKAAAEKVSRAVRNEVQRNGLNGGSLGGEQPNAKSAIPSQIAPDTAQRFSDPINGEGVKGQVAATKIADKPREAFSTDAAARADLQKKIDAGAPRSEIDNHPAVVDAVKKMGDIPETVNSDGYGTLAWHEKRHYVVDGKTIVGTQNALDGWVSKSKTLAADETGIPAQPVENGAEATIILGPPAAGKSGIGNKIALARKAAIVDADEIKKTLPEFQGGIGANAVHEESSHLTAVVEGVLMGEKTNVVIPKVGASEASISKVIARYKAAGYSVKLVNMDVTPENAYRRMIGRFVSTGRLIPPKYMAEVGSRPTDTFMKLKKQGVADGYGRIDNNGGRNGAKQVSEISGQDPFANSPFDAAQGGGNGSQVNGGRGENGSPGATPQSGGSPEIQQALKGTKIADKKGNPIVVYHSTHSDVAPAFTAHRPGGGANEGKKNAAGVYFSSNKGFSKFFGPNTYEYYIDVKNPLVIEGRGRLEKLIDALRGAKGKKAARKFMFDQSNTTKYISADDVARLKAQGYDGIVNDAANEIIVFDPAQIHEAKAVQSEATPAGQQTLIQGVAPITQKDRLQSAQNQPMQGGAAPAGGLFDEAARAQMDLLDMVPLEDTAPNGDTSTRTVSRADLAKELDAADNFVEQLGVCVR